MNIKSPSQGDLPKLKALWKEAFGDTDEYIDTFFSVAFSEDRCFSAWDGDKLAGALYFFNCSFDGHPIAYLYGVATAKAYRGRGVCRRLMEHTHSVLRSRGYVGSILVPAGKDLFDFYRKLGYNVCTYVDEITVLANGSSCKLLEITASCYESARRALLPPHGVVQEGENISFLASVSRFYRGDGFIMTAYKEGSHLFCAEFLGDSSRFSEAVAALGCNTGTFRTVGEGKPFAMYRSFTEKTIQPSYFSLAFD